MVEANHQPLFLRHGFGNIRNRIEDFLHRKGRGLVFSEVGSAPHKLDNVACHLTQSQRRTIDQAELTVLQLVDVAAEPTLERFCQEQDRSQWGAKIVGNFNQEFGSIHGGEPLDKIFCCIRLDGRLNRFDCLQGREHLAGSTQPVGGAPNVHQLPANEAQ